MPTALNASPFRPFELEALRHLLGAELSVAWLGKLEAEATLVSYEYSGGGYFLTVAHPMLPAERFVYSEPPVLGTAGDAQAGFLVFIERGELMLECHAWGNSGVPPEFRDKNVQVALGEGINAVRTHGDSAA